MPYLPWLFAGGPLVLAALGLLPLPMLRHPASMALAASLAALLSLTTAFCGAVAISLWGPLQTPLIGLRGIGLSLYLDALSATLFLLVSFIGVIVVRYSRNYLDGDPGHACFTRRLCLTLSAILFVIVSGNLFLLLGAWIATSLSLNRLLLFYPERQAAVLAARKKFVVSRLGDLCLVAAMVLLYRQFGTLDIPALLEHARALHIAGAAPGNAPVAALLLVIAALLKSAQFPLHGWLLEVMETPTPVSALLHAGIVNAGGFLVLRLGELISLSPATLELMAVVGAITALFGSLVMLTQTSVKVALAYSTIGQMGFMMLECGLGAFPAALLHLIGHSLYKAHAFLSSGSIIDLSRAAWTPQADAKPHPARLALASISMIALALGAGWLFGVTVSGQPGVLSLGAIVLLGLTHLIANAIDARPNHYVIGRAFGIAGLVAAAYFALQWAAEKLFAGVLPAILPLRGPADLVIVILVLVSFAAAMVLQNLLGSLAGGAIWQAAYVHLSNGLYVNSLANRFALKFWPTGPTIIKHGEGS